MKKIFLILLLLILGGSVYFLFFSNQPISSDEIKQGVDINLELGVDQKLVLKSSEYLLRAVEINPDNSVLFNIRKKGEAGFDFNLGESGYNEKIIDINRDFINDFDAKLTNIDRDEGKVLVYFKEVSTQVCDPSWACTDWYPCIYDKTQVTECPVGSTTIGECYIGTQTRDCSDNNNCGVTTGRPALEQTCYVPIEA